jgi:hypothetical protein
LRKALGSRTNRTVEEEEFIGKNAEYYEKRS